MVSFHMTESEWLTTAAPQSMLYALRTASRRTLRLFGCACCRLVWDHIIDERSRRAVEAAEKWADGLLTTGELLVFHRSAQAAQDDYTASLTSNYFDAVSDSLIAATCVCAPNKKIIRLLAKAVRGAIYASSGLAWRPAMLKAERLQADLLRDIFGNPFRPVTLDLGWLTPEVVRLAHVIYDGRAFDLMPSLGDALERAGCDGPDIVSHFRSQTVHVRGCWALDTLLGKQ
jgi:hypothetical protein